MGAYDGISSEELRERLVLFARLLLELEEKGELLEHSPDVMELLGELRRMIFAWEVRGTARIERDGGEEAEEDEPDSLLDESLRVVREAQERERELQDELGDRLFPDDEG